MGSHVDLVENRWSAGYQERVGTVQISGGAPNVELAKERYNHYREVVLNSMPELMATSTERWFNALPQHFHSDYFFATEPHDDASCPFADGDQVALSQTEQHHPVSA